MRVLTVLGSPRKQGNTAKVLGWVEDELRRLGHGVDRINVIDHRIEGCQECHICQEIEDDPECVQNSDDLPALFAQLIEAELIVIASPVFCWGFPSQLKALIDRCYCLAKVQRGKEHSPLIRDRNFALLITCGGVTEGNADLLVAPFRKMADFMMGRPVGELLVGNCTAPDSLDAEAKARAARFAKRITPVEE